MRTKFTNANLLRLARTSAVLTIGAVAAGCSSDVMRFSDDFYTSAVPQSPTTVAQGAPYQQPAYGSNIDPATTGSVPPANGAMVSGPRRPTQIATPQPTAGVGAMASPAPLPARVAPITPTDPINTSSVARAPVAPPVMSRGGWTAEGARTVILRDGETIATLSKRYGVPESAILNVNGIRSAGSVRAGQSIRIPVFSRERLASAATQPLQPPVTPQLSAPKRDAVIADGGRYTVSAGDTLSSISRRTGASVSAIKLTNGLSSDTIRIGQRLVIPGLSAEGTEKVARIKKIDPVITSGIKRRPTTNEVKGYTPPAPTAKTPQAAAPPAEKKTARAPDAAGAATMRWPVNGRVISAFQSKSSGKPNDGIDISVPKGTAVKAADKGVVIYAGDGLKELGKTILIRHGDGVVTVYGHASDLNVQRGDTVKRGQTIAASGMSGSAKQPQLHFEVRKDSKPVNPVTYLQ